MNWKDRLDAKTRPRIGLAWSGRSMHKNDRNQSIEVSALLPLLGFDASYVSLQQEVRASDATVLRERSDLFHFGDELKDFSDTASADIELGPYYSGMDFIALHPPLALAARSRRQPLVPDRPPISAR